MMLFQTCQFASVCGIRRDNGLACCRRLAGALECLQRRFSGRPEGSSHDLALLFDQMKANCLKKNKKIDALDALRRNIPSTVIIRPLLGVHGVSDQLLRLAALPLPSRGVVTQIPVDLCEKCTR